MQSTKTDPINWWEKKRLIYNAALILAFIIIYMKHNNSSLQLDLMDAMIWLIGANLFYTLSWAFEVLYIRKFNKALLNNTTRYAVFIIGTLFSMWWTDLHL